MSPIVLRLPLQIENTAERSRHVAVHIDKLLGELLLPGIAETKRFHLFKRSLADLFHARSEAKQVVELLLPRRALLDRLNQKLHFLDQEIDAARDQRHLPYRCHWMPPGSSVIQDGRATAACDGRDSLTRSCMTLRASAVTRLM